MHGLQHLVIGDGGDVSFSATGHTSNVSDGTYDLDTFVVDGLTTGGVASALASLAHGVSLQAQSLQLVHGTLEVHGQVSIDAQLLNVSSGATIDGEGNSNYGERGGPGIVSDEDDGGKKMYAGSHGGVGGGWGTVSMLCKRRCHSNPRHPSPPWCLARRHAVPGLYRCLICLRRTRRWVDV